jgi:hypothetical protein
MRTTSPPRKNDRGWRGGRFGPGPRRAARRRAPVGARPSYMPARGRRGGGFPIWLGILLLIGLGVILWLFLKGDAFNSDSTASTGSDTTADGTANPDGAAAGTIAIGSDDLLVVAGDGNDALVDREGETVTADGAVVQSVVGDEAFWVGTGLDARVLVVIDTSGASAPSVGAGDRVSFSGSLEPLPIDFADRYGVTSSEDIDLLTNQGHFVRTDQVQQV